MLHPLETYFADAMRALLGPSCVVAVGPTAPKTRGDSVQVCAHHMTLPPPSADLGDERSAAREFKLKQWEDDGATFALPPGGGQLVEVESPPGRPLRRDDDYIVDGEVLRLLHPTTATVRALLVGPPARGFIERRPCALTLILSVRAKKRLDRLMESALAAALRASVDLPDLGGSVRLNARVRLRRPTAALVGITRAEDAGVRRPRCDIELLVRGELEMTVATGEADPAARIASVERSLTLPP